MNNEEAKQAIAQIDYKISILMSAIASLNKDKQKLRSDLTALNSKKKDRLRKLQDDINSTRLPQQKKRKREVKAREGKVFDNQIMSKKKQIDTLAKRLVEKKDEVAKLRVLKQRIKLEINKSK